MTEVNENETVEHEDAQLSEAPEEAATPGVRGVGHVYVLSNQTTGNSVTVFSRAIDGALTRRGTFPTGGLGAGDSSGVSTALNPLNSQGALVMTDDRRFLLAVDAGSNEISVLAIEGDRLEVTDRVPSGGTYPVSVANHRNLVYVVNQGQTGHLPPDPSGPPATVSGFTLSDDGKLTPIPESTQVLSGGPASAPGEITFRPDGSQLVVTERLANVIDVFPVDDDGLIGKPVENPSNGVGPFSATFHTNDILLVTEVTNFVSTYRVRRDGSLRVITASLPLTELAPCWSLNSIVDPDVAYVANSCSGSISAVRFDRQGAVTLVPDGAAGGIDGHIAVMRDSKAPLDMALSRDGRFLYVLTGGYSDNLTDPRLPTFVDGAPYGEKMSISSFRVEVRAGLTPIGGYGVADDAPQVIEQIFITGYTPGLQAGHQGIVAT